MRRRDCYVAVAWFGCCFAGCNSEPAVVEPAARPEVHVLVAASVVDAITQIAKNFEQHSATKITINAAATSALAQQVLAGADAELFISADEQWAGVLDDAGLVGERSDLLGNRLVLIVPERNSASNVKSLEDLATDGVKQVALAEPDSVPAGRYARQALEKTHLWDRVVKKIAAGENVRQALWFVERGEADAGIVYATDAVNNTKVRVVAHVDPQLHEPVKYPLLVLKSGMHHLPTREFRDELRSAEAAKVFEQFGFTVFKAPPPDAGSPDTANQPKAAQPAETTPAAKP